MNLLNDIRLESRPFQLLQALLHSTAGNSALNTNALLFEGAAQINIVLRLQHVGVVAVEVLNGFDHACPRPEL